jgi:hypothetical protein
MQFILRPLAFFLECDAHNRADETAVVTDGDRDRGLCVDSFCSGLDAA